MKVNSRSAIIRVIVSYWVELDALNFISCRSWVGTLDYLIPDLAGKAGLQLGSP